MAEIKSLTGMMSLEKAKEIVGDMDPETREDLTPEEKEAVMVIGLEVNQRRMTVEEAAALTGKNRRH